MRHFKSAIQIFALVAASLCNIAHATDGDLDDTFGTSGLASTHFANTIAAIKDTAVLPNGRVLIATQLTRSNGDVDIAVVRFSADGSLDTSFSFDGNVLTNLGGSTDQLSAMLVQSDGKIVLCGNTLKLSGSGYDDIGITRLNADGTLDNSFGSSGKTRVGFDQAPYGDNTLCAAMALQPDGKIVVVGSAQKVNTAIDYDFAIVRLNTDGSLDSTFNQTGKQVVAFDAAGTTLNDTAAAIAIDSDGGILIGGSSDQGAPSHPLPSMAIARLLANGQLDGNFNANGTAIIGYTANGDASWMGQILVQPDHKIVAVGYVSEDSPPTYYAFAAARLFPDGSADTQFGPFGTGRTRISFDLIPMAIDAATSGVLQSDGKIVLAGLAQSVMSPQASAVAFVRLNSNGLLDSSFGDSGKFSATLPLGAVALQAAVRPHLQGGRVVAAVGQQNNSAAAGVVGAVRLQSDLIFVSGFQ